MYALDCCKEKTVLAKKPKRDLEAPPIARSNSEAVEVLTVWAAPGEPQQLTLRTTWKDAGAWALSLCLVATLAEVYGQSPGPPTQSPKQVVDEYWKFETEGGRLTPEGWRKAQIFFVRSGPLPPEKNIGVVSERTKAKCSTDERSVSESRATIVNDCFNLGRIDELLHYTAPDPRYEKTTGIVHNLLLTDKHWEVGPDGTTEKEVTGPLAWRIQNPEPFFWLTVSAAIRYVERAKTETKDPKIKSNAEQTLAALAKFQ